MVLINLPRGIFLGEEYQRRAAEILGAEPATRTCLYCPETGTVESFTDKVYAELRFTEVMRRAPTQQDVVTGGEVYAYLHEVEGL